MLGFRLVQDTRLGDDRRWVLVAPPGPTGCALLLAKAKNDAEAAAVGRQAGGRMFLFLHTDDFRRDYETLRVRGVQFCEPPREEAYGTVAVFVDVYGNRWDLLQLRAEPLPGAAIAPAELRIATPAAKSDESKNPTSSPRWLGRGDGFSDVGRHFAG